MFAYINYTQSDKELNRELYYESAHNDKYLDYYKLLFDDEGYNTNLKMGLDWFVMTYDDVYTHKSKNF